MVYNCDDCGREFKFISKLKEHQNRKTSCKTQQKSIPTQQNGISTQQNGISTQQNGIPTSTNNTPPDDKKCDDCGKVFGAKWLLVRHKQVCKGDPLQCPKCLKTFSSRKGRSQHERTKPKLCLEIELERIKEDIANKHHSNTGAINITINNTNNIDQSINNSVVGMVAYKDEKYDMIDKDMIKRLWNDTKEDPYKFARMITQEVSKNNRNLKITNLRSNSALEWDGECYNAVPQGEAIENCLTKMTERMEEVVERKSQLQRPVRDMESWIGEPDDDDDKADKLSFRLNRRRGLESIKHGLYVKE